MAQSDEIQIFYSWQSDLSEKTNKNAIRRALRTAQNNIEAPRPGLNIVVDEATRDTSGSPNIPSKILEKIEDADIIVADVTTITRPPAPRPVADVTTVTRPPAYRPCPNPNVIFELGYAVAYLGWERVILLFNEQFGDFPKDLPFDFAHHRATRYKLAKSDPQSADNRLTKILEQAITLIIDKNPKRPAETRGLSREKIEHARDVQNMERIMSTIHLPTMDEYIRDLPHGIADHAMWMWEGFSEVASSSLFSIYDPVLNKAVDQLFRSWSGTMSHSHHYSAGRGGRSVFISPGDMLLTDEDRDAWSDILKARDQMQEALHVILKQLKDGYFELDIYAVSEEAGKMYSGVN